MVVLMWPQVCRVCHIRFHGFGRLKIDSNYVRSRPLTLQYTAVFLLLFTAPSPPQDNVRVMVIFWRLRGILELIILFTVTHICAVLTGPTDWVCHIGTLTLCVEAVAWSYIIVTWWSGSGGIQAWSRRLAGLIVLEMTYNVLSLTSSEQPTNHYS